MEHIGMRCEVLNPLKIDRWDDHLSHWPNATFFHAQCWAKVLHETYGYESKYLSVFREDKICFLLPMIEVKSVFTGYRGVSLPFTDYVGPVGTCQENVQNLWMALVAFANKSRWRYIDLRGDAGFQETESVYDSFYYHDIQLVPDVSLVFSSFSDNHKRNIKKAIREGVEVEIRHDIESVEEFFFLNAITRKRHGIPSQPYKFFKNIYKYIISDGKGMVVIAKKDGNVVAGSIYFLFGENAIYKYGASKVEARCLRANNLVMWEAIKWLSNNNFKRLSLGRTEKGNTGLLRYKNGWGAEQKSINYYRYSMKDNVFIEKRKVPGSLGVRFFKAAPVSISNLIGGVLYRHVG